MSAVMNGPWLSIGRWIAWKLSCRQKPMRIWSGPLAIQPFQLTQGVTSRLILTVAPSDWRDWKMGLLSSHLLGASSRAQSQLSSSFAFRHQC